MAKSKSGITFPPQRQARTAGARAGSAPATGGVRCRASCRRTKASAKESVAGRPYERTAEPCAERTSADPSCTCSRCGSPEADARALRERSIPVGHAKIRAIRLNATTMPAAAAKKLYTVRHSSIHGRGVFASTEIAEARGSSSTRASARRGTKPSPSRTAIPTIPPHRSLRDRRRPRHRCPRARQRRTLDQSFVRAELRDARRRGGPRVHRGQAPDPARRGADLRLPAVGRRPAHPQASAHSTPVAAAPRNAAVRCSAIWK